MDISCSYFTIALCKAWLMSFLFTTIVFKKTPQKVGGVFLKDYKVNYKVNKEVFPPAAVVSVLITRSVPKRVT